jgi:hypothetical protein
MAKLIYPALMSLEGHISDKNRDFNWAEPDVHSFIECQ